MISVENLNTAYPKFPVTVEDKGWVYGVWYCGTSFTKSRLHGEYPPTFVRRALALFPEASDVLHCPSGTVEHGVTVDRVFDGVRVPRIVADAADLPFRDESFDLVLSDPPYTRSDAEKYGCSPWPQQRAMAEAHRVLRGGGASRGAEHALPHVPTPQLEARWADRRGHGLSASDPNVRDLREEVTVDLMATLVSVARRGPKPGTGGRPRKKQGSKGTYARVTVGKKPGSQKYLHRVRTGAGKGQVVHHRDGNTRNNSRSNLKKTTRSAHVAHHNRHR